MLDANGGCFMPMVILWIMWTWTCIKTCMDMGFVLLWICWICIAMDHVVDHCLLWIMYWPSGFYQSQIHAHTGFVGFILLW